MNISLLFSELVKSFVIHPDRLRVESSEDGKHQTIQFTGYGGDAGRIIGEAGEHYRALIDLAAYLSKRNGKRIILLPVLNGDGGTDNTDRHAMFAENPRWPAEAIQRRLVEITSALFGAVTVERDDVPGAVTKFGVHVRCSDEKVVDSIGHALAVIFNAIGKANGRTLVVTLYPATIPAG